MKVDGSFAYFDLLGDNGKNSDLINDDLEKVELSVSGNMISGQTDDNHQLVGVRRWTLDVDGGPVDGYLVKLKTESYDRARNLPIYIGMNMVGESEQMVVWTQYFQNITKEYWEQYGATSLGAK